MWAEGPKMQKKAEKMVTELYTLGSGGLEKCGFQSGALVATTCTESLMISAKTKGCEHGQILLG